MTPFVVPTRFTAIDGMSPVIKGMASNLNKMHAGIARQERLFRSITPSIGNATKQLLSYASAGTIFAGLGYSGKAIMDYETSLQSLQAVTGVSTEEMAKMKAEVEALAATTKKSATDIAGSFEVVGSMMSQYLSDPKALRQITDAGITLAKAGRTELVPTLENLTSIMNQFDLKANQATETINRLTAGEIVGSLRTSQVAESLQEFGAGAYAANVNLAESVALVEALAKQMKTDKIGVGARNLLTVLDSAKGLDKKARKDLKSSGVDLGFLMDKSKSLSERLHELAKISGDSAKITSVFGKENKTAAQVIFNQLDTYDQYLAKIKLTNEAQTQATTNSKTFKYAIDELKNTWINYIATGDTANKGLNMASKAMQYLATNMDTIVSTGLHVVGGLLLWKGAITAVKVATLAYQGVMLATNAVANTFFLVDMVKYVAVTKGVSTATAAWAIVQESLNTALLANPIGITVAAVVALTAAVYFLNKRQEDLLATYQTQLDLRINESAAKEKAGIDSLTQSYIAMGYSIKKATEEALKLKSFQASENLQRIKSEKVKLAAEALERANNNTWNPFFSHSANREQLDAKNQELTQAMAAKNAVTMEAIRAANAGIVDPKSVSSILNQSSAPKGLTRTPEMDKKITDTFLPKEKQWTPAGGEKTNDQSNLINELKTVLGAQKVTVEFKNAPAGTMVSTTSAGVNTQSSY